MPGISPRPRRRRRRRSVNRSRRWGPRRSRRSGRRPPAAPGSDPRSAAPRPAPRSSTPRSSSRSPRSSSPGPSVVVVEVVDSSPAHRWRRSRCTRPVARSSPSRLVAALVSSSATFGSTSPGRLVDGGRRTPSPGSARSRSCRTGLLLDRGQQAEQLARVIGGDRAVVARAAAGERECENAREQGYPGPPRHRGESSYRLCRPATFIAPRRAGGPGALEARRRRSRRRRCRCRRRPGGRSPARTRCRARARRRGGRRRGAGRRCPD